MRNIIHLVSVMLLTLCSYNGKAQELKLKDGQVLQGETAIFSYDKKVLNNEFHLYRLNTDKTIVDIKQVHKGGGETSAVNDYKTLLFAKQNILIESKILRTRNWKFIIQLLLDEKVIDSNGMVNIPNLESFAGKYDEKITPRN